MAEESVRVTIDGTQLSVPPGTTILEAAARLGIDTPTLCYHPTYQQPSACRACVVEVEGARTLAPACSQKVSDGMVVYTDSERVRHSRRMVLELLQSARDTSLSADIEHYASRYGTTPERFTGGKKLEYPVIDDNPFFVRDYSKCILCNRCVQACGVEAQFTFAIAVGGRGFDATIQAGGSRGMVDSPCVFCGQCVGVCPTGALMGKPEYKLHVQPAEVADDD